MTIGIKINQAQSLAASPTQKVYQNNQIRYFSQRVVIVDFISC